MNKNTIEHLSFTNSTFLILMFLVVTLMGSVISSFKNANAQQGAIEKETSTPTFTPEASSAVTPFPSTVIQPTEGIGQAELMSLYEGSETPSPRVMLPIVFKPFVTNTPTPQPTSTSLPWPTSPPPPCGVGASVVNQNAFTFQVRLTSRVGAYEVKYRVNWICSNGGGLTGTYNYGFVQGNVYITFNSYGCRGSASIVSWQCLR